MQFRLFAVSLVALVFAFAQTVGSGASFIDSANVYAASLDPQRPAATVLQDEDDDNEEDDDADDGDNTDDDAADDGDNTDDDDSADDEDDDNAEDDGVDTAAPVDTNPAIDDESLRQPLQPASGTSNGGDILVATPGERIAVRMFSWMPAGVQVTIRPIDPTTMVAAPGTRAGDLAFVVEATDANGVQLTALPAEVNLAVRYADSTVSGLNEANLTLSRLDLTTNQWQTAPKLVREPDSNYLAASVLDLGTYVVSAN